MKWTPRDVIALVIIVGCFVLRALGHDSYVSWSLLGVVAGYYGLVGSTTIHEKVIKYKNGKECSK